MNRSLALSIATLLAGVAAPALAQTPKFSSLDYARKATQGSIAFIPLLSSDPSYEQGITFYTSFVNDISMPIAVGSGMKYLEVIVLPAAHDHDAAEYNAFFDGTNRIDKQEFWFGSGNPCGISAALAPFTDGLPSGLQPVVNAAGYPQVCHATIYFRASQQTALLALLRANRGITVKDSVPLCAASSPVYETAPIVEALETKGALADDGSGVLVGSAFTIASELRRFRLANPSQLSRNGETSFIVDAFASAGPSDLALRDDYTDTRFTACNPAALSIAYGD